MEIQLLFSISILPSVALKRWNFPDNLDFKGKVVAKKCVTYIMAFFIPFHYTCVTLCQSYSIPCLLKFTKNNKLWNERKEGFFIYGCFSVSRCIKGGRKSYLNNPYWQSSRIVTFSCKYYIATLDTLMGSWMCFSCCSL